MKNITRFDVLIVYAQSLAKSASCSSVTNTTPFPSGSRNASYNIVYSYFLKTCRRYKLTAAFTTSADIIGPGLCRSFWLYQNDRWSKVDSPCYSPLIFDKFSPVSSGIKSRRQLLFSSAETKPFNHPDLFNLFFDKQLTYQALPEYCIPTISVKHNTFQGLNHACSSLKKFMAGYPGLSDFTSDIVIKDRFGAGGRHVYKFTVGQFEKMLSLVRKNRHISFVIQPFAKFDLGFSYHHLLASTDIRFIYLHGKIVQTYIRVAKSGEFRCNEHQGGLLTYLAINAIPLALVAKSNLITKILNKNCSLYALDFIICNSGRSYLLEGNTGPGLDWNMALTKNEQQAKKLIRLIVAELVLRTKPEPFINPQPFISKPLFSPALLNYSALNKLYN